MGTRRSSGRRIALRRRIDRIARDRDSGAVQIAADVAQVLADAARLGYTPDRMARLRKRFADAHAAMGSVWNAAHADDPLQFSRALRKHTRDTIRYARRALPKAGTVVTLSFSSSVIDAIGRKGRSVIVAESLPGGEGTRTARALRRHGARCTVVPDATLAVATADAAFGVIGADAVTPTHVVNKVGSHLLGLACEAAEIPFYVIADASKLVPDDWTLPQYEPKRPFEAVPRSLVTQILCDGLIGAEGASG